eukprot:TRINITY_DN1260_c0_g1_i3.p1 TRINITY_DN1260_c0_g1~~TRINITY_DN1260_c0_g1_i3.p1  ORF type:complete len:134 (-),score=22.21 TRINITY_DN1260_c0_g1_i3:51-452(-)
MKMFQVRDSFVKMQIWDTAGQEKFRTVTRSYFRGAQGIMIVFDVSRRSTYSHVRRWLEEIESLASPDVCVVIIGNKCDLTDRQVTTEEAQEYADSLDVPYFETSASTSEGVNEAFHHMAEVLLNRTTGFGRLL